MSFCLSRLDDPFFAGFEHASERLRPLEGDRWPTLEQIDDALRPLLSPHGLRCAPDLPRRRKRHAPLCDRYDQRIVDKGEVPTRAGSWHDLFGALVFATFPHAKRALHRRQARLSMKQQIPGSVRLTNRCPEADLLTRFDEGGSLVFLPEGAALPMAWRTSAPVDLRAVESAHRTCVFGHGALEAHWLGRALGRSTLLVVPVPASAFREGHSGAAGRDEQWPEVFDVALSEILERRTYEQLLAIAFVARFNDLACAPMK